MAYGKNDSFIDLGAFDERGDSLLSLNDWIKLYEQKTRRPLNAGTVRKRRAIACLGTLVPPRMYLLSKAEFEQVLATPLPMCKNVMNG